MTYILAAIGVVLLILEVITISTFLVWIAIGFIAASIVSIFTTNIFIIAFVGVAATVLSLLVLKTKYVRLVMPKTREETAFNELIGKHAIMQNDYVVNGVDIGLARVAGIDWSVQGQVEDQIFAQGERVLILRIEGVRLIIGKEDKS